MIRKQAKSVNATLAAESGKPATNLHHSSESCHDTATQFDTDETLFENFGSETTAPKSHGIPVETESNAKANLAIPASVNFVSTRIDNGHARSPGHVASQHQTGNSLYPLTNGDWETTVRGMPSWLSSLILHLTLILILAVLSVNDRGKSVIDLLASTNEPVEIETIVPIDIALEVSDIESAIDDSEFNESILAENQELTSILDDSLLVMDEQFNDNLGLADAIGNQGIAGLGGGGRTPGGAQFFGVDGTGSEFVYIVDCSGSMGDYGRWKTAVRELKKSINDLKPDQRFLILLYNTGFIAMNDNAVLVAPTKKSKNKAIRWLARNRPNAWTYCAEALAKALSLKPDAIFLLSDGEFDDRINVFTVLKELNDKSRLVSENENQIPVHTIALGSHQGRFTMKRIAEENSGTFRLID